MDEFGSETDSEYTSYWRDWVSRLPVFRGQAHELRFSLLRNSP